MLYLIKKDEVNIYDIPISRIAGEFLNYIKLIQFFDIELAGDFLLMASTLMQIKSQMLLPRKINQETGELEDPRTQLVERLLEYKRYKESSKLLNEMYESQKYHLNRIIFDADYKYDEAAESLSGVTIFDLMSALNKILDKTDPSAFTHEVKLLNITIEDKTAEILSELIKKRRLSFFALMENKARMEIIITFLAVLELIKLQKIYVRQEEVFDDIAIALMPEIN